MITKERLKELREKLGVSQSLFGIIMGYDPKTAKFAISQFERSVRTIPNYYEPLVIMLEAHGTTALDTFISTRLDKESGA